MRRGLASAAKDNGGLCSFPYCNCWTAYDASCLSTSVPVISGNTYSFTVASNCGQPLARSCSQDLNKIELNSCEPGLHS